MATASNMGPIRRGASLVLLTALALPATPAAQGVLRTLDPFYQGESARRDFYGGLAVSGEVVYRTADPLRPAGGAAPNDVALSAQLDYTLLPQVDVSAVFDLSGGIGRGPTGLSWLVVKPYWFNDDTDYAVRIAVDPASEGGLGFRQTDVAFLSTTTHAPTLTSDFAIGLRRVRTGYTVEEDALEPGSPIEPSGGPGSSALLAAEGQVRVIGRELHATWGYNVLFDPAGSHLAVALLAEAGDYRLIPTGPEATGSEERVRSGIGWLRAGVEWSRPAYQVSPFLAIPLVTWADVQGEPVRHGPRPDRTRFGLRLMLR
jgi:hypothetical protein